MYAQRSSPFLCFSHVLESHVTQSPDRESHHHWCCDYFWLTYILMRGSASAHEMVLYLYSLMVDGCLVPELFRVSRVWSFPLPVPCSPRLPCYSDKFKTFRYQRWILDLEAACKFK